MENKEKELSNEKFAEDLVKAQLGEDVFEKVYAEDIIEVREEIDKVGKKIVDFKNKEKNVRDPKIKDYYKEKKEIYTKNLEELKKKRDDLKEIAEVNKNKAKINNLNNLNDLEREPQTALVVSEIKQEIIQTKSESPLELEKVIAPKENKLGVWNSQANVWSAHDNPESALIDEIMPAIGKLENNINASAIRDMEMQIKDIYSYNVSEIKSGKKTEEWDIIQNCSAKAILESASYRDSSFGPFVGEIDHEEINNRIELQNYLKELTIKNKIEPEENETVKDFIFRAIKSIKNSPELDYWMKQKEKAERLTPHSIQ